VLSGYGGGLDSLPGTFTVGSSPFTKYSAPHFSIQKKSFPPLNFNASKAYLGLSKPQIGFYLYYPYIGWESTSGQRFITQDLWIGPPLYPFASNPALKFAGSLFSELPQGCPPLPT